MSFNERTLFQTDSEDLAPTVTRDGEAVENQNTELFRRYQDILDEKRHSWTTHLRLLKKLGAGGQGIVFLTERRGSDSFTLPVALKIFSPERYATPSHYDADMARMGRVIADHDGRDVACAHQAHCHSDCESGVVASHGLR